MDDYQHSDDTSDSKNSPSCDDSTSIHRAEVVNIKEAEVRVQMIEKHNGQTLFGLSPIVVHIKDASKCSKEAGEAFDINNHLYMSRLMQNHFNGIATIPIDTPSFIIRYLSHDATHLDCPLIDEDAIAVNPAKKRQRVTVHIIFRDEEFANHLAVLLKSDCIKINSRTFEMYLFFEAAEKAREYLTWKEEQTLQKWNDIDITD